MRDESLVNSTALVHSVYRQRYMRHSGYVGNWYYPPSYNKVVSDETFQLLRKGRADLILGDHSTPNPYFAFNLQITPGTVDSSPTGWVGRVYNDDLYLWVEEYYEGLWVPDNVTGYAYKERSWWGDPYTPDSVIEGAQGSAFAKIRDSKVNLANNLGELRESYSMMADTLRRCVLAYRAARRKDWNGVRRHLGASHWTRAVDELGNQWLAYRYGWRPLMSDLYNLREKILSSFREEGPHFWAVGHREATFNPWEDFFSSEFSQTGTARHGCTVKYRFRVTDATLSAWDSLGFANPIALTWELTRYSFVVDWFVSVGDFLEALGNPLGTEFIDGYQTTYVYEDYEFEPKGEPYQLSSPCRSSSFGFYRTVLPTYPKPTPYVRMGLNPTRALDSLLLLKQRL